MKIQINREREVGRTGWKLKVEKWYYLFVEIESLNGNPLFKNKGIEVKDEHRVYMENINHWRHGGMNK